MQRIKKKPVKPVSKASAKKVKGYKAFVASIATINTQAVLRAASMVNQALVLRNWIIGTTIVEFEQNGTDRAKYGAKLLETLARDLKTRGLKGLDLRTLRDCRKLTMVYPQIRGSLTPELPTPLTAKEILRLSWSKIQELIRIDDVWKRAFYENECLKSHWSVRQLQRQIESLLYERMGLSRNKKSIIAHAKKQEPAENLADMLRDPYILEFTGLAERPMYSEEQFESALLDHLQRFLLELGRGFCFEARQFRMTEGRKHHRVDLVFYHRLLRCHILFELKVRAFRPSDVGQMNFYVNWFKANMKTDGDNPPVGILLCSDRDGAEVEFATAGIDQKLFVSRYLTKLPSAKQLKDFLEQDRAEIKALTSKRK